MAYHDNSARVVLFGGVDGALLDDTWVWATGMWSATTPATVPTARRSHAMAADNLAQNVVMFGGLSAGGQLGDTWLWDGTDWQQVMPVTSPSPRTGHAMAYDESRQRVVLFGGTSAGVQLADTWEWDGGNWTQVNSGSSPVARVGHAVSYDRLRQRVVLFGGSNAGLGALADTWEWNGSLWQPRFAANYPAARSGHSMAFDAALGTTILFGGVAGTNAADTWQWDGIDWSQITPAVGQPAPRTETSLVFADGDQRLIFFGGENGGSLPDTWTAGAVASTYGAGCGSPALAFAPGTSGPFVGQTVDGTITNAPSSIAAVMLGVDRDFFGPFPLPLPLDSFGLTGCDLLQSAEIVGLPVTVAGPGSLSFQVALPNVQGLVGRHLYGQAFAFAPGQNPAELIVSNGVDWLLRCPPLAPQMIVEDFNNSLQMEVNASAGGWVGGLGVFSRIGGDARHGDFDIGIAVNTGEVIGNRAVYEINCDYTEIPAALTTTGAAATVTDGRFFFGGMVVGPDQHLRFVGSQPPVITVAGRIQILGVVDVSAPDMEFHIGATVLGQPGGASGVFGGAGGKGGDRCLGVGPGTGEFDGGDGSPANVMSGYAFAASVAATPGRGSALYPASGLNQSQQFGATPTVGLMYCLSAVAGGSGGGLFQSGQAGAVVGVLSGTTPLPNQAAFMGPPSAAGLALQVLPLPVAVNSSQHFLLGGAGGGGAASNSTLSLNVARSWASGSGGGGGGGAIALRAGRTVTVHAGARVLATGGSARDYIGVSAGAQTAPGGGGSGGSVLIQAVSATQSQGEINVSGGFGGTFRRQGGAGIGPSGGVVEIKGGDGGAGYIRYETAVAGSPLMLPGAIPAATSQNVGSLIETDDTASMRSLFYSTNLACSPKFSRYELDAVINNTPMTFSDDPAISPMMAVFGAPVRVLFQAGQADLLTGVTVPVGPWRESVRSAPGKSGIEVDGGNAFRFMVVADYTLATTVQVDRVAVTYEN